MKTNRNARKFQKVGVLHKSVMGFYERRKTGNVKEQNLEKEHQLKCAPKIITFCQLPNDGLEWWASEQWKWEIEKEHVGRKWV